MLVDDVDGGIALFVTEERTAGSLATIELVAGDGSALWRDEVALED